MSLHSSAMRGVIVKSRWSIATYGMLYALFRQPVLMELQFMSEFIDKAPLTDVLVLEVLQLCHDLIPVFRLRVSSMRCSKCLSLLLQNANLFT
ncbi:MAG: hypothetical protein IPF95_18035 [Flavobacteriales bacterium]|nr:hypothetical protein [Flavobacteriales bacterium]